MQEGCSFILEHMNLATSLAAPAARPFYRGKHTLVITLNAKVGAERCLEHHPPAVRDPHELTNYIALNNTGNFL